jgi:SAM-dependent methyltransferase
MKRIPEPELMTEQGQAEAYARADFEESHSRMIDLMVELLPEAAFSGAALDLGCGPGDISYRLARIAPALQVHGVDGSAAMLEAGAIIAARHPDVTDRVTLYAGLLPDCTLPRAHYDLVVSNSLLHHLHDPAVLWSSVLRWTRPGGYVFVMDLRRPEDRETVEQLVDRHAADEPAVLRQDFANSLAAAYRVDEVERQLAGMGLGGLQAQSVGDRHLIVHGRVGATA